MKDAGRTREGPWDGLGDNSDVLDDTIVHDEDPEPTPKAAYPPGTSVNRYLILHEVGAGGMGVVYAAFDPQLNRKIALKILIPKAAQQRRGVDQAATRLMREAQAIARLSHPNVVNVYDVGRHEDAVFVAMEFIEGQTLTQWLEREEPPQAKIRAVFGLAGRGLIAAHDAGLVHRDFKPDNVLVGADGRVRVLDFGLARADPSSNASISQVSALGGDSDNNVELSDGVPEFRDFGDSDVLSSPLTLDDAVVGTPRYMAPEQHAGAGVGPRSDQFSFCVALFQALYGIEPFPASHLHELVRLKQEGRVTEIPAEANVPPWLEELVLRGLAPRPAQRWPNMAELVAVLEDDPVSTRRRRVGMVAGVVLLAGVTAAAGHQLGSGGDVRPCQDGAAHVESLWSDVRRESVRGAFLQTDLPYAEHTWEGVERRVDANLETWVRTHRETCEATRVTGEQSDELLDLRMSCLHEHLAEVRAVLDVFDDADPAVVQRAVAIVSGLPGLESCADTERLRARLPLPEDEATRQQIEVLRQTLRDVSALGAVRRQQEARALAEGALESAELLGYEPLIVEAMLAVGIALENSSDFTEAEARLRDVMWAGLRIGHDAVAARAATQLVSVVGDRLARYDEGITWADQARALLDRIDDQGSARASLYNNLGNVLHRKGDNDQALLYYQDAIAKRSELTGDDSPLVAVERINLGNALLHLGRYDDALETYQAARGVLETTLGQGHPQVATAEASIGVVYNETGRYEDALAQHRKALPAFEAWLGPEHLFVATTIANAGVALRGMGRFEEAYRELRRAQKLYEDKLGADHPEVARGLHNLASVRADQQRLDEARRLHERALELRQRHFGEEHPMVIVSRVALAGLRRRRGDAAGAVGALEALASRAEPLELESDLRAELHFELALARWDAGQLDARVRGELLRAEAFLDEAGAGGTNVGTKIEEWKLEHPTDDRERAPDGTIAGQPAGPGEPSGISKGAPPPPPPPAG
ncbi:MAG: tetratricopeptide repeat protein [Deltaproteobacteria bacterium]|nr:tetratricopeptide repeat protein [Deltaproteobacteria bacterium]